MLDIYHTLSMSVFTFSFESHKDPRLSLVATPHPNRPRHVQPCNDSKSYPKNINSQPPTHHQSSSVQPHKKLIQHRLEIKNLPVRIRPQK